MTSLASQKRIAAVVLKCGVTRVRMQQVKDVEDALTRQDIRNLVRKGLIWKEQKKGTSKFYSRKRLAQKKKGRRKGHGSRKGRVTAYLKKQNWLSTVRTLRRTLKKLKVEGRIEGRTYTDLYLKIKGGAFRSRGHLMLYLKEHELIKKAAVKTAGPKAEKTPKPQKAAAKPKARKAKAAEPITAKPASDKQAGS